MVTLLIVSEPDLASTIQGDALLNRGGWRESIEVEGCKCWTHTDRPVHIWWLSERILWEDGVDSRYEKGAGLSEGAVSEVIFLSRHFAASGMPSLTLHVIGVPGEEQVGEPAEYGGIKGEVVPPNPRFAAWFRLMCAAATKHKLNDEFDLTIETTHHGPSLKSPTMFIEIGSSESHWGRRDAAEAWADVLTRGLNLDGVGGNAIQCGDWKALSADEKAQAKVMVGIGGGHYAPRHTDVIRKTDCWAGHQLASYALPMKKPEDENWDPDSGEYPLGQWQHAIKVSIDSTRQVFDGSQVIAHLDRKSFKGWQRRVIKRLLAELDVPIGRTVDFE